LFLKTLAYSTVLAVACLAIGYAAAQDAADSAESRSQVRKGIDLARYYAMVDAVRENPEFGVLTFRAANETEDMLYHGKACISTFKIGDEEFGQTRQHIIHTGLPLELQTEAVEPVDRVEPVELALAAMGDCVIGTINIYALLNDIDVDRVSAEVSAPVDTAVLLDLADLEQRHDMYGPLQINVQIEGDSLTEADRRFLEEQALRSPVFNLIALDHDVMPVVTISNAD